MLGPLIPTRSAVGYHSAKLRVKRENKKWQPKTLLGSKTNASDPQTTTMISPTKLLSTYRYSGCCKGSLNRKLSGRFCGDVNMALDGYLKFYLQLLHCNANTRNIAGHGHLLRTSAEIEHHWSVQVYGRWGRVE